MVAGCSTRSLVRRDGNGWLPDDHLQPRLDGVRLLVCDDLQDEEDEAPVGGGSRDPDLRTRAVRLVEPGRDILFGIVCRDSGDLRLRCARFVESLQYSQAALPRGCRAARRGGPCPAGRAVALVPRAAEDGIDVAALRAGELDREPDRHLVRG